MRIAILILAAAAGVCAQSFEVASVKINKSGSGSSNGPFVMKGKLVGTNVPMRRILQVAWGFQPQQIIGPAWIDADRFDLAGTTPAGAPDSEIKPMLQSLLKDRFQLTTHLEKRELPVYNLVIAKEGLKIKPVSPSDPPRNPTRMPGVPSMLINLSGMDGVASMLTGAAGRPVVDKTGLPGRYYVEVQYGPLRTDSDPDQAPDIFAAVQQQLGLRLEPGRAELDTLVVDHIERTPTEN